LSTPRCWAFIRHLRGAYCRCLSILTLGHLSLPALLQDQAGHAPRHLRNSSINPAKNGKPLLRTATNKKSSAACQIEIRPNDAPDFSPFDCGLERGASSRNRLKREVMNLEPPVRTAMLAAIPKLRAFSISLCRNGDQAEDLVQDTLLRACANIMSFTPGTNMLAWLCTILKNHFYSECRRRRRAFKAIDDHADSVASKPAQIAHAEYNELWAALAKLEPKRREALIMIGASGLSYGEAAEICGCPRGTVKSRVNRARAELAQLLSIEGPEDFEEDPVIAAVIADGDRALPPLA
jgi:RNA polymerase sigma-70 factor, ECF subfamily